MLEPECFSDSSSFSHFTLQKIHAPIEYWVSDFLKKKIQRQSLTDPENFQTLTFSQWEKSVHPEDIRGYRKLIKEFIKNGNPGYACEIRIRKNGKEYRWIREEGRVLERDSANRIIRLNGTHTDITETRQCFSSPENPSEKTNFFNLTPDLLAVVDFEGFILNINPSWEKALGWTSDELVGKPWIDFIHPEDMGKTISLNLRIQEGNQVLEFQNRFRTKDHSYKWFSWNIFPVRDENRIYLVIRDITRRKKSEREMKRRDALLSGVSLSTHFLLARKTNFNQSMIHALEALGRSTGVDRVYIFENHYDSSKGENITSQIFEWTRDAKLKEINNPLLKNISYEKYLIRWYHTLSQGRPVHGDVKDFPWTERSFLEPQKIQSILVLPIIIEDRFWGFIGFDDCAQTREWSESEISILAAAAGSLGSAVVRKRAENSLKESESRFRDVVNAVGEYIWETDARGHFVFLTDKIQEILGYTPSQCLGKTFFDFMSPPEAARIKKIYLKARDNQKPLYNLEIKTIHKNQETVWQRISAIPVLNGNNEVIGYRGAALDITQQFRNLEEIKKAKNAAEKNAEDKSRFLSHMSHEIRTPMNVIKGLSDLLLEETLTESMRENVEAIGFSANNLLAVINDILDFSKIESGKITFESISFDLREFIHKNIQAFRVKAREKNLVMESRIDEKIPQFLKGDPYKLNQILTNLLGNAIKFTHEGKIALEAELSHQEPWKAVINFRVSDTGIGIPKKRLKTVFESFSQAGPDTTRKYGGTGLGLTICKNLIEKQGGSIKVRSIPGKGTVFEFHLPFTLEKQVKKTAPEKKEKQSLKGVKLLIAEDNPMNQFLLKRVLEKWDTDFEIVENGLKVLEKLQTTKYDLILMDIQMPEMDGLEATEVIRNSSSLKDIPIIAFTANAMDRYFTKNENRLFDEVVLKPVNQQELYEKIKTLFPDFSLKKAPESPTEKVDLSYIEEFVREEPPEKMKELLELFITNLDRNRTFIEESMHRKDWKSLARAAHTLKNDFLNVRLKQSAEKFEQMEQIALYEKDMGLLKEIIDEILFLINKVHTEVDLILSDFNADN